MEVYRHDYQYAVEHGETKKYIDSLQESLMCRKSIETAINIGYRDNRLDLSGVKDVIARFGSERVSFVLAETARAFSHDGRVSPEVKLWSKTVPGTDDPNISREMIIQKCHIGLVNLFTKAVMKEAAEKQMKPQRHDPER